MLRAIGYAAGTSVIALAGGDLIYAIWDTLIREELVRNSSFTWFPVVAVLWGSVCLGVGGLRYRRRSQPHASQPRSPPTEARK